MAESIGKETKLIARHSAIYGLANVLDRAVGFIMLPVYTRFLTPDDYGVLELIYMTMSVIALVVGLGIEAAVSRFYFDHEDEDRRKIVVSSAFVGYGSMALLLVLALVPASGFFAEVILDSSALAPLFVVGLITLGCSFISPIALAYLRVRQKSGTILIIQVTKTALALSLNIYFVVFAGKGVFGILLASLIAECAFAVFLTISTLWHTGLRVDYGILKGMVKFGLPLIPSNISAYIVQASDRYFVKEYINMGSAGLYSLGYKFGTLINQFVTSPFIQIWTPRRFEYFNKPGADQIYARIFTYFCSISVFVGLMISMLSKEVIQVMATEPFWPAYKVVPVITLAYIIFSFHYHFNIGILMKKATKYVAYTNIANGILNLILNFIMIRIYGIWGAAFATLACFIFKASMTYYFSNRLYKIHVEWRRVGTLFSAGFMLYFMSLLIETSSIWGNLAAKAAFGCTYPLLLYLLRLFDDSEIKKIKQIIKTREISFD